MATVALRPAEDSLDEFAVSETVESALEALDDIVYRTGAPATPDALARVVEKRGLDIEAAALLRVRAREDGLLAEEEAEEAPTIRARGSEASPEGDGFTTLEAFFRSARRYPLLSASQEVQLARRYEQGEAASARLREDTALGPSEQRAMLEMVEDGELAKATFICCNLRLVASIARRHRGQGLELPDMVQEGILGLIRAVEKFDHRMGFKFSTYATWWIRQAISRAIADKGRTIRLPVHVHELLSKIIAMDRRLQWELEREPTIHEIAERIGEDAGHVAFVRDAARSVVSLDATVRSGADEDGDVSLYALIPSLEPSVESQVIANDREELLMEALSALSSREAEVLKRRYGIDDHPPSTLDAVGRELGLTRERIRQLQVRAEEQLAAIMIALELTRSNRMSRPEPQRRRVDEAKTCSQPSVRSNEQGNPISEHSPKSMTAL